MRFAIHRFASVASTMDVCREFAEQGAAEGLVIVADEQTAGRGRAGRAWFSPPGQSLYVSVLLRPHLPPRQTSWLTMIGALAAADSISQFSILNSQLSIKWFNDVLLNGKKIAGVLVETSLTGDHLDYAVLGIGLNVNTRFDDAPDEVKARATSLREVLGVELDREAMLDRLLVTFGARYSTLPKSPVAEYARHLDTLGKHVQMNVGADIVAGQAVRVEDDGALVVLTTAGERTISFGDVLP
jgi:BirA family biotin operon repressor/biotin-[acetyl-CoA-carboxylase] ligase